MKYLVTIADNNGNRNELTQAVCELTEGLVGRRCAEFTWRSTGDNAYTVAFDLDQTPGLTKEDLKEAVREFNDSDFGTTCTLAKGESNGPVSPINCEVSPLGRLASAVRNWFARS